MEYQAVTFIRKSGARFDHAIVDSGYITRIRDVEGIPFSSDDIEEIIVTNEPWDFNRERSQE